MLMGLTCDKSTDVSVTKQLRVFTRVITSTYGVSYRCIQTLKYLMVKQRLMRVLFLLAYRNMG